MCAAIRRVVAATSLLAAATSFQVTASPAHLSRHLAFVPLTSSSFSCSKARNVRATSSVRRAATVTSRMTPSCYVGGVEDLAAFTMPDDTSFDMVAQSPSLLLSYGDLSNLQVAGYFGVLFAIVGGIFGLSLRDKFKNDQIRNNRDDFIGSIQMEIAALETEGDEESLEVASELKEKLLELEEDMMRDKIEMLETRWFGLGKFVMPEGMSSEKKPEKKSGSSVTPGAFGKTKDASEYVTPEGQNRFERRQKKKLMKKRVKREN